MRERPRVKPGVTSKSVTDLKKQSRQTFLLIVRVIFDRRLLSTPNFLHGEKIPPFILVIKTFPVSVPRNEHIIIRAFSPQCLKIFTVTIDFDRFTS